MHPAPLTPKPPANPVRLTKTEVRLRGKAAPVEPVKADRATSAEEEALLFGEGELREEAKDQLRDASQ